MPSDEDPLNVGNRVKLRRCPKFTRVKAYSKTDTGGPSKSAKVRSPIYPFDGRKSRSVALVVQ